MTNLLLARARVQSAQDALVWLTGSLAATPWSNVAIVLTVALAALPVVALCARWLPLMRLGTTTASGLGVSPGVVRAVAIGTAVLLTAVTCAFAGPIAFIALCAPALARPLLGHGAVALGTSAGVGAVLLVGADAIAQSGVLGHVVPVGVVTGALGALFLLALLATSKGRSL